MFFTTEKYLRNIKLGILNETELSYFFKALWLEMGGDFFFKASSWILVSPEIVSNLSSFVGHLPTESTDGC